MTNEGLFSTDRVTVVGVLNLTPDSFSDGGRLMTARGKWCPEAVRSSARQLEAGGATILDIGGESTRPGAAEVPVADEIERTEEAIAFLAGQTALPLSIDTRKAEVAERAVAAGACMINDVSGLSFDPELAEVAARSHAILVLGHTRGTPDTMQQRPEYEDVLEEVASELEDSVDRARSAGVAPQRIVVDPGIGFGKRLEDNLQLIAHVGWLRGRLGVPVLIGPSRKAFLGRLTGDSVSERDLASHAACAVAAFAGADAVRVHDADGARRCVSVGRALRDARRKDLP